MVTHQHSQIFQNRYKITSLRVEALSLYLSWFIDETWNKMLYLILIINNHKNLTWPPLYIEVLKRKGSSVMILDILKYFFFIYLIRLAFHPVVLRNVPINRQIEKKYVLLAPNSYNFWLKCQIMTSNWPVWRLFNFSLSIYLTSSLVVWFQMALKSASWAPSYLIDLDILT